MKKKQGIWFCYLFKKRMNEKRQREINENFQRDSKYQWMGFDRIPIDCAINKILQIKIDFKSTFEEDFNLKFEEDFNSKFDKDFKKN